MVNRLLGWFFGLGFGRKVLAVLFAVLLLFSASTLVFSTVFRLIGTEDSGAGNGSQPVGDEATQGDNDPVPVEFKISRARWVGDRAEVEGRWHGDISSVHCDLFEEHQEATDWWDRGVAPKMFWAEQTFSQDFVEAKGRKIKEPIHRQTSYEVVCSARFSDGWLINDTAPVTGIPPA